MIACTVLQLPCTGCGANTPCRTYNSTTGTISTRTGSTSNPGYYAGSSNCAWIIGPGGGVQLLATMTHFHTEKDADFVEMFQCADATCSRTQLLASLSGSIYTSPKYSSKSGYMLVKFSSNSENHGFGFTLTWEVVVCGPSFIAYPV
jgi:hypothetical protein